MIALKSDNTVESISLSDTYMGSVEITVSNGNVKSIILLGAPTFRASYENGVITVSVKEKLSGIGYADITKLVRIDAENETETEVDCSGFEVDFSENDGFVMTVTAPATALEAGAYTLSFQLDDAAFSVGFIVK